MIGILIRI